MAVSAGGNWRSSSLVRGWEASEVPGQEGEESPGEAEEPAGVRGFMLTRSSVARAGGPPFSSGSDI